MKKTIATILLGVALLAPASAQTAGNPRTEPVDAKATDRVNTQTGTGLLPKDAKGQSSSSFSLPNRDFRAGSPVNSGAQDIKQFPAPPAAITPSEAQIPIQSFPAQAPPAIDIKNAGDTTLDSSTSRDVKTLTAPPAAQPAESGPIRTQEPSSTSNAEGVSKNPSTAQYSTKNAPLDSNSTLLPSPTGPRDNARSTRLTPSPREVRPAGTFNQPKVQTPGGEQPR